MARAPKKDKFHSVAPQEVADLLEEVIGDFHDALGNTNFLILMKHGGWKSKGKAVLGKVQVLNDAFRRTMKQDVILYLNADMWAVLSKPQRKYLLDHQMYQLDTACDRHGNVKEAADGRPLLTTVPHDIEGFVDVVKRHGIIMEDVKRLARAMTETNQITLEEALQFESNENAAAEFREKVEPREGLSGETKPDGTVELKEKVSIEELGLSPGSDDAAADTTDPKVTDIRAPRVTKKEKEEKARLEAEADAAGENKPLPAADDDLPF